MRKGSSCVVGALGLALFVVACSDAGVDGSGEGALPEESPSETSGSTQAGRPSPAPSGPVSPSTPSGEGTDAGGADASTDDPGDDAGTPPDAGGGGGGGGGGGTIDAGGGGGGGGGTPDAGGGTATGPGPRPTRTCSYTADSAGFFQLTTRTGGYAYWVRLPTGYNAANAYPMVIGAHGCGDTAKNFATWAMAPAASRATQSYIAVSVGAGRDGQCWTAAQDEAKVLAVLDDVRTCFYAHQKKITMAGYSSGGILAYTTALKNAKRFAGLLIENSSLQSAFGSGTDAALAAAGWKLNVAITARTGDTSFAIANVRTDRTKLQNARFPVQYRELAGGHDGSSDDWSGFLLPKIGAFVAP